MRLREPRIAPLDEADWDEESRQLMGPIATANDGRIDNVFRTLLNHPKLAKRWMVFANHILFKSSLPPRERELLILRIGWLCRAGYEWAQHVAIAKRSGCDDADIARIKSGPDADGWTPAEALLLRATDELHADSFVGEATWRALAEHFSPQQMMDVVFTVGQYNLVSMALNSFGVQVDEYLDDSDGPRA